MGMAFVFVATGTLTFAGVGQQLGQLGASPLLILGAALMLSAIAFKLSLAPFHAWAGDVYEGAPVPVTAFLGSVSKVAMVALAVRLLLETSLPAFVVVDKVVVVLIVLSVLIGNLLALKQVSLKRMLAYSSVAHMGYALMALAALGLQADTLTTMYMIIYALTTLASFGVIALMSQTVHGIEADNVAVYQGLFWRRPVLTAVMTVALLSLAGIPSTAGFMTKVQIMLALVQSGRFWLGGLLIIGSAISLYYYLGVILMMYKRPLATIDFDVADNWRSRAGGVVLLLISGLLLWWGVLPNSLYALAQLAQIAH